MITAINESKTLTKYISCECKCKFDGRKSTSDQRWNNDKCWCEYKKYHICEKDCIWNPSTCSCENGKYLLVFLLITIELLRAVSIYWYLIKYQAKQKHLLPFHVTINELKEIMC